MPIINTKSDNRYVYYLDVANSLENWIKIMQIEGDVIHNATTYAWLAQLILGTTTTRYGQ